MARPSARSVLSKEDSELSLHGITPTEHHDQALYLESFKGPDAAPFARLAQEVPVLRGYLKKQMTRSKWKLRFFASWQTRYFILYPGFLLWCSKEGGKITGLIPLETYHYVAQVKTAFNGRQFDMLISRTPTQRHTFCFLAADEEGASQWVKHIKIVIRYFGTQKQKPAFDTTGKFWKKPELMLNVGFASQPGWENKIRDFLNDKQGKSASTKASSTNNPKDLLFRPSNMSTLGQDPGGTRRSKATPSVSQTSTTTTTMSRVLSDSSLNTRNSIRPSNSTPKIDASPIKKQNPIHTSASASNVHHSNSPILSGKIGGDIIKGEMLQSNVPTFKNPLSDMDAFEKELLEGEESDDEFEAELVAEEEKKAALAAKKRADNQPKSLFGGNPVRPVTSSSSSSSSSSLSSSSTTSPPSSPQTAKKPLTISTGSNGLSISTSTSLTPKGVSFPVESKKDVLPEKGKTKEQEEILQAKAEAAAKNKQMLLELEAEQKLEDQKAAAKKSLMDAIYASAEEEVKQKVEEDGIPKCDECEDEPIPNATVWCNDCEQNLCKKCDLDLHHGNRVNHLRTAPRVDGDDDDNEQAEPVSRLTTVEMTPISNLDLSPGGRSNELGVISEDRGRSISGASTPSPTHMALSTPPHTTPTGTPVSASPSPSFSALHSSPTFKPSTPTSPTPMQTTPSPTTSKTFLLPATGASIASTTTVAPRGSPVKPVVDQKKPAAKKKGKGDDSDDEDGPTTAEEEAEINRIMGRGQPPKQTSGLSLAERQQQRMMAMAGKSPTKSTQSTSTSAQGRISPSPSGQGRTSPSPSTGILRASSPTPQQSSPIRSSSPAPTTVVQRSLTASPTPPKTSPASSVMVVSPSKQPETKTLPPTETKKKEEPKKEKEKKGLFGRIAQAVSGDSDDDDEEDDGEDMQEEIDRIMKGPKPSTSTAAPTGQKLSLAERAALAHSRAAGRH